MVTDPNAAWITFLNRKLVDVSGADNPLFESARDESPMIAIGKSIDGSWFGMVTCLSPGANLSVHHRPSLRAAKELLAKRIRGLHDELATLFLAKNTAHPTRDHIVATVVERG